MIIVWEVLVREDIVQGVYVLKIVQGVYVLKMVTCRKGKRKLFLTYESI